MLPLSDCKQFLISIDLNDKQIELIRDALYLVCKEVIANILKSPPTII